MTMATTATIGSNSNINNETATSTKRLVATQYQQQQYESEGKKTTNPANKKYNTKNTHWNCIHFIFIECFACTSHCLHSCRCVFIIGHLRSWKVANVWISRSNSHSNGTAQSVLFSKPFNMAFCIQNSNCRLSKWKINKCPVFNYTWEFAHLSFFDFSLWYSLSTKSITSKEIACWFDSISLLLIPRLVHLYISMKWKQNGMNCVFH